MNKNQIEQGKKVISNLKQHPLLLCGSTEDTWRHIEDKLIDGKYPNVNSFIQELKDQISTQYNQNPEEEYYTYCHQFSLNILQKELNKSNLFDADTWSKLIIKYNNRYKSTLRELTEKKENYITLRDLQNFQAATEYLKDEKSVQKMIKIIKNKEPKQNIEKSNINITLTKLQKPTIISLIDFAKESLSKRNIPYPS